MIQKYIIDGNNLIGKIPNLWKLQNSDRQLSRVKLVKMLDQYFSMKRVKASLHFDGYASESIPTSKLAITYSNKASADSRIKKEIDDSTVTKAIVVVSSDHSVQNYAKVNSCKIVKSEDFAKELLAKNKGDSEEAINKSISNEEMKKLFGL